MLVEKNPQFHPQLSLDNPLSQSLRITEIFYSLQGEARTVGCPTVFVRLTGCPLRCQYCDTSYAFSGGEVRALEEIVAEVGQYGAAYVTVTGGEPLAQKDCWPLVTALCDLGAEVSIETSGAVDITGLDPRAVVVMDLKTPGSDELHRNRYENIALLKPSDQVKFVLCDRKDYDWAKLIVDQYNLVERVETVLFSPSQGQLEAQSLAEWVLEDRLNVRFQLQLHKFIWGDEKGR